MGDLSGVQRKWKVAPLNLIVWTCSTLQVKLFPGARSSKCPPVALVRSELFAELSEFDEQMLGREKRRSGDRAVTGLVC